MDQENFSAVDRFIGETIVAEDEGLRAQSRPSASRATMAS